MKMTYRTTIVLLACLLCGCFDAPDKVADLLRMVTTDVNEPGDVVPIPIDPMIPVGVEPGSSDPPVGGPECDSRRKGKTPPSPPLIGIARGNYEQDDE